MFARFVFWGRFFLLRPAFPEVAEGVRFDRAGAYRQAEHLLERGDVAASSNHFHGEGRSEPALPLPMETLRSLSAGGNSLSILD